MRLEGERKEEERGRLKERERGKEKEKMAFYRKR